MKHRFLVIGMFGLTLATISLKAEQRPNFSGRWIAAPNQTPAFDSQLGPELSLTQSSAWIVIDRRVPNAPENPSLYRTFYLNGTETTITIPPRPADAPRAWIGAERMGWAATWTGTQLNLTTKTMLTTTPASGPPLSERHLQTINSTLSLDRDGNLIAEHVITVDPPVGFPGTPTRVVYHKR